MAKDPKRIISKNLQYLPLLSLDTMNIGSFHRFMNISFHLLLLIKFLYLQVSTYFKRDYLNFSSPIFFTNSHCKKKKRKIKLNYRPNTPKTSSVNENALSSQIHKIICQNDTPNCHRTDQQRQSQENLIESYLKKFGNPKTPKRSDPIPDMKASDTLSEKNSAENIGDNFHTGLGLPSQIDSAIYTLSETIDPISAIDSLKALISEIINQSDFLESCEGFSEKNYKNHFIPVKNEGLHFSIISNETIRKLWSLFKKIKPSEVQDKINSKSLTQLVDIISKSSSSTQSVYLRNVFKKMENDSTVMEDENVPENIQNSIVEQCLFLNISSVTSSIFIFQLVSGGYLTKKV
ncbi:hypothetical protein AYI68_g3047 [Smittium mucronatum]|uniref:Uncharacterized protein n=1 Tax=Smittium mucronatum TaxID=133383 RepID=A0A1R0H108_9FUNG|nr:hypothetical protein AYI68_g3047 [Smittium mucronatum]